MQAMRTEGFGRVGAHIWTLSKNGTNRRVGCGASPLWPRRRSRLGFMRAFRFAGVLAAVGGGMYYAIFRRRVLTWGATESEATSRLPGDELLEDVSGMSTRAIDIDAPASAVWPWLAQMGPSPRGGAYTYDWIENLLRLDMHTVDRVLPEFQRPKSGKRSAWAPTPCASSGWSRSACWLGAPKTETGSGRSCSHTTRAAPG